MSAVNDKIIRRFANCYGEPKAPDVDGFLDEYERVLKGYSADTLRKAADEIIANHVFPNWPTPGECNAACLRICERERPRSWELPDDTPRHWAPPTEEEKRRNREKIAQFKAYVANNSWLPLEPVKLPVPDRKYMEALQDEAIKTADGYSRHVRALSERSKRMMGEHD
ncbi:MAG: hypothetical protein BVN33_14815 [Proteobacteria bacterium ST_bin13]|nr:MAG: hypothetical protein BVN33_14815 [Proteobacteria bacterium ST_bin13]